MVTCKHCGTELEDDTLICYICGEARDKPTVKWEEPRKASHGEVGGEDATRSLAVCAYLAVFIVIPIRKGKDSEYVRFHVTQGLSLLAWEAAYLLLYVVLAFVCLRSYRYAPIVIGLLTLVFLGFLALTVVGVLNAARGRRKKLPLIGGLRIDILVKGRFSDMLKRFYPDEYVGSVYRIDFRRYYEEGVRGVLFDIDNTLVEHGADASRKAEELFRTLEEMGFRTCLISNNRKERVERFNRNIGTKAIYRAGKPGKAGYLKAMGMMGTSLADTIFVGDQLFTDIYGAKRLGMRNVLVNPVGKKEEVQIVVKRWVERIVLHHYHKRRDE